MTDIEAESRSKPYHHGELREALLEAAEQELAEKGPDGFSLRSTAKRAGVSHAAPAHHFRDVHDLLDALSQRGFERLTDMMRTEYAVLGDGDAAHQLIGCGIGYVRFALENQALFHLMFATRKSGEKSPELVKAAEGALSVLLNGVSRLRGPAALAAEAGWEDVTALWSMVHGYAHLVAGGKMTWMTDRPFDDQRPVIEAMVRRALGKG